jgi:lipopolysaccharide export system permease protein
VIRAKRGELLKTADDRYLTIHLLDGVSYDEVSANRREDDLPHIKSAFEEDYILMDLSGFDLQRTDEELWKNHMQMLNMKQLTASIDSLQVQKENRRNDFLNYMDRSISLSDSTAQLPDSVSEELAFDSLSTLRKRRVVNVAINMTRNSKNYMHRTSEEMANREEYIDKHKIEWHRKLTLSFACIVLFFIGAPLGAIIKKGGLGLPVIFSVIFFLVFHITSISGEKMVESGVVEPFTGMWLSSMILLPIAIFLTYKAIKDAALFDRDTYTKYIERVHSWIRTKLKNSF